MDERIVFYTIDCIYGLSTYFVVVVVVVRVCVNVTSFLSSCTDRDPWFVLS